MNGWKMLDLQSMVVTAMKERNAAKAKAYKNIKAKKEELLKAKNAKPYDDAAEIKMLKKMVDELQSDYDLAIEAKREDKAAEAKEELEIIKALLPKEATEKDIQNVIDKWVEINGQPQKNQMGLLIKEVKCVLPTADGSLVASLVKKTIG